MNNSRYLMVVLLFAVLTASPLFAQRSPKPVAKLEGHTDMIQLAEFSPDGKKIVSISDDNTLRIWDARTGKQQHKFTMPEDAEYASGNENKKLGFSADNTKFFIEWDPLDDESGKERKIIFFDTETGKKAAKEKITQPKRTKTVEVINGEDGKRSITIRGAAAKTAFSSYTHPYPIYEAKLSPDETLLVYHADDGDYEDGRGVLYVVDLQSGRKLQKLDGHMPIWYFAFSPDSKQILAALGDGMSDPENRKSPIYIWNLSTVWNGGGIRNRQKQATPEPPDGDLILDDEDTKPVKPAEPTNSYLPKTLSFTPVEIRDPQLNNERAMTTALPEGWKVKETNVLWTPAVYNDPARINYTLIGPADEVTVWYTSKMTFAWNDSYLRFMKREQVEGNVDAGNIYLKPMKPEEFIQWSLQRTNDVSDIKIKTVERPKLIVEQIKKAESETSKQIQELIRFTGSRMTVKKLTYDTALVTFTCVKEGKQYEQQIGVITQYLHSVSPLAAAGMGNANDEMVYWTVSPIFSAYALEGKLKKYEPEIALIIGNTARNPIWDSKVLYFQQQVHAAIAKQQLQNINDQAEHQRRMQSSMQETFDYIRKARQSTFANRSDAMSRVNQGWTDVITQTDRWKDNSGKIYAAPSGYQYGYRDSEGKMMFSRQPMSAPPGFTPMNKTPWAW